MLWRKLSSRDEDQTRSRRSHHLPQPLKHAPFSFTDQTEDFLLPDLDLTRVVDESQDRLIEDAFSDDVAWTEMNEHDQQDLSTDSLGLEHVAAVDSTDDYRYKKNTKSPRIMRWRDILIIQ